MTITLYSIQAFLIPVMLIFAYNGWYRGLYREFGNFLVLAIGLAVTTVGGDLLVTFVNNLIVLGPRIFNLLLNRSDPGLAITPPIPADINDARNWLFRLVLFIVVAVLTYTVTFPWERDPKGNIRKPAQGFVEKPLGAVFGAGIGYVFFTAFQTFYYEFFNVQGRTAPLQGPASVTIPTPNGIDSVIGFLPTLAVLALVVLVILIIFRLPRIWQ